MYRDSGLCNRELDWTLEIGIVWIEKLQSARRKILKISKWLLLILFHAELSPRIRFDIKTEFGDISLKN